MASETSHTCSHGRSNECSHGCRQMSFLPHTCQFTRRIIVHALKRINHATFNPSKSHQQSQAPRYRASPRISPAPMQSETSHTCSHRHPATVLRTRHALRHGSRGHLVEDLVGVLEMQSLLCLQRHGTGMRGRGGRERQREGRGGAAERMRRGGRREGEEWGRDEGAEPGVGCRRSSPRCDARLAAPKAWLP